MSDSTASDADKIRAKRLAKLGGIQPSTSTQTPESSASASQPTAASASSHAPSAPSQIAKGDGRAAAGKETIVSASSNAPQASPQIKIRPRPSSPAKRERDGSEKPRITQAEKPAEALEVWQDRNLRQVFRVTLNPEETKDAHGHPLIFLAGTRDELQEEDTPLLLTVEMLDGVITEAGGNSPRSKPFEYLLACFKRVSRGIRGTKYSGPEDPKHDILKETRRLCMSYCALAVTTPDLFGLPEDGSNALVDHLLADPEGDTGICQDFLNEAESRFEEDDTPKELFMNAAVELSRRLSTLNMLNDYTPHVRGLLSLVRSKIVGAALTESPAWCPDSIEAQDIETKTILGPFFRLSPIQPAEAKNFFSSPTTRDRAFIYNNQDIIRSTLRTHQAQLFQVVNAIVRASPAARERVLDWFAVCVNKNHKRRAMRVDTKVVSSDGFMVNVTSILDQLCEPFMDVSFSKIDRIDPNYLRRTSRVDVSDETKINADQKTADDFYGQKADGKSNFISEIFFLTLAAHHYGTEATQTRLGPMKKNATRWENDLKTLEAQRHKYIGDSRYLQRFEEHIRKLREQIDELWSTIHATYGIILDTTTQARSVQFMRYVIVWLLRLASHQNLPKEQLKIPLPFAQPEIVKCLPEYIIEGVVDNFKFITAHIPHILAPQQCDELIQVCITFLRSSEYIKNPGVKSGLVTILCYGCQPDPQSSRPKGVLGDLLIGSSFANEHLLHALMKFYIEAESTGSHTQFFDKFNIRYEIFLVIKCIWINSLYREKLGKEAAINTDFFVQFVNLLVNDVTFVLDESLSSLIKIRDLSKELADQTAMAELDEEQRKAKQELLEDNKRRAKSYMQLTKETMEMLILFSESLSEAFTMPEIVTRLADMLDYNLDSMVGPKRANLVVENASEYGFAPKALLSDIMTVFVNLSGRENFINAIARDGRSYKPANFEEATGIMKRWVLKSPDELQIWTALGQKVAAAKARDEEEEADLGDAPDEFMDPLVFDLMDDPVILPASKQTINRSTIRSHLLSDPTDPFNRSPLKIEDVVPNTELKAQIEAWKMEKKADKAAERANQMDTSGG